MHAKDFCDIGSIFSFCVPVYRITLSFLIDVQFQYIIINQINAVNLHFFLALSIIIHLLLLAYRKPIVWSCFILPFTFAVSCCQFFARFTSLYVRFLFLSHTVTSTPHPILCLPPLIDCFADIYSFLNSLS